MPAINAEDGGEISIKLQFNYLERKLQKIEQKIDQLIKMVKELEEKCGGGGQMGGRAGKTRGHEMG